MSLFRNHAVKCDCGRRISGQRMYSSYVGTSSALSCLGGFRGTRMCREHGLFLFSCELVAGHRPGFCTWPPPAAVWSAPTPAPSPSAASSGSPSHHPGPPPAPPCRQPRASEHPLCWKCRCSVYRPSFYPERAKERTPIKRLHGRNNFLKQEDMIHMETLLVVLKGRPTSEGNYFSCAATKMVLAQNPTVQVSCSLSLKVSLERPANGKY